MFRLIFHLVLLIACIGCANSRPPGGNDVVVWISIDGMRHDYVERDLDRLPTLAGLMRDGAFTRQLAPVFPSITFPSHVSQVTGVPVSEHGITGNTFYDSRTRQKHAYPEEASLIEAEPIWATASRQGVRTAVIQWPMSYRQRGRFRADYFDDAFERELTDADRLDCLLEVWRNDDPSKHGGKPLRLLMGYMPGVDQIGHRHGPDSAELREAMVKTDALLAEFLVEAQRLFARDHADARDRLWVVITSDHGMTPGRGVMRIDDLLGAGTADDLHAVTNGPVADLFLDDVPSFVRRATADALVRRLREHPQVRAWRRDELPAGWQCDHPHRTGDVVALLDVGWSWRSSAAPTTSAGPRGQHGHSVDDGVNMFGFAVISVNGLRQGTHDLGRVDSLQLHPTVARRLGIEAARGASATAIPLRR